MSARGQRFEVAPSDWTDEVIYRRGGDAAVGISLFHTVGDRERALDTLATGFATLQDEVMKAAGYQANPYKPASGTIWNWWQVVGVPTLNEWQAFHADQAGSYWSRFSTNWETYETWQARLAQLRDLVENHGIKLASPPMVDLPKTLPGSVLDAAGGAVQAIGHVGHVALWGAVALGAAFAGVTIVNLARGRGRR